MDYEWFTDDQFALMNTSFIEWLAVYNNICIYSKELKIWKYMQ